jgi:hypothetical protein
MALEQQSSSSNQTEVVVARTPTEKANLERFDQLDFDAWNNRNWTLFSEIHSPDVLVVDFSGNTTRGIEQHLQWAMAFTSSQPESKIQFIRSRLRQVTGLLRRGPCQETTP